MANSVRIAALVILGTSVSGELALGAFHSKSGWILFCLVALFVAWLSQHRFFTLQDASGERLAEAVSTVGVNGSAATENATAAFLTPQLCVIAVALTSGAFFAPLDRLYWLRILVAALAVNHYRRRYVLPWPSLSPVPIAVGLLLVPVWLALLPEPSSDLATSVEVFSRQLAGLSAWERSSWLRR